MPPSRRLAVLGDHLVPQDAAGVVSWLRGLFGGDSEPEPPEPEPPAADPAPAAETVEPSRIGQSLGSTTGDNEIQLDSTVTLRDGIEMCSARRPRTPPHPAHPTPLTRCTAAVRPLFGLGTWRAEKGGECREACDAAMSMDYLLIDTASGYDNEEDVGAAIRESGRARENIFVVTKNSGGHSREETIQALDDSLERLGLDFVDLYLVQ